MSADGAPSRSSSRERAWETHVLDELTAIFCERDRAILLATNAGYPRAQLPNFVTSQFFWTKVLDEARNGLVRGGVRAIVTKAAEMYPGNRIFAHYSGGPAQPRAKDRSVIFGKPSTTSPIDKTISAKVEAECTKIRAEAKLMEAQAQLAKAKAIRELSNAAKALRQAGHEILIESRAGGDLKVTIRSSSQW